MIGPLGVAVGSCGGRQIVNGVQGDAGSGFSTSNGTSGGSGSNTTGGSAGGTGSGSNGTGESSSGTADGGSSGAASGSTGSGSTQAASGSMNLWPSGSVHAATPPRCGFSPHPGSASSGPTASAKPILSSLHQFIADYP